MQDTLDRKEEGSAVVADTAARLRRAEKFIFGLQS
jgi:hypothetical protein